MNNTYSPIDKLNKLSIDPIEQLSKDEEDKIILSATHLISDANFKPYFFKTLKIIGAKNFMQAVFDTEASKDPRCRPCVFVSKLKKYRDAAERQN